MVEKYGNFSTPTLMKMASKYNKANDKVPEFQKVDAKKLAEQVTHELNTRLDQEHHAYSQVHNEVSKFEHMNGFINVFLQNEQFMDRV